MDSDELPLTGRTNSRFSAIAHAGEFDATMRRRLGVAASDEDTPGETASPGPDQPGPKSQSVVAAVLAALDVGIAVAANRFFDSLVWKIVVPAAGAVVVLVKIFEVRGTQGIGRTFRRIVAGRLFWALTAALVTALLTGAVFHYTGWGQSSTPLPPPSQSVSRTPAPPKPTTGTPTPSEPATAVSTTPSPSSSSSDLCNAKVGEPGVVAVHLETALPAGLTICPVLLNNGLPITGPFPVAGQFLGPANLYSKLIIVNQGDRSTCDAFGVRPPQGYFAARGLVIEKDGTWSFEEPLGYDQAVTTARNYQIISAPPASVTAIMDDEQIWKKNHPNDPGGYPGMIPLPANARVLATFRQPPGTYDGKTPTCQGS